jgi:hypothetical protein
MMRRLFVSLLSGFLFVSPAFADDSNDFDTTVPDYAEGQRLYNMGRLADAFDQFEKSSKKNQNRAEAEKYMSRIRAEVVGATKRRQQERASILGGSGLPENALTVTYVDKGHVRLTLQAKLLFDENTAFLKTNSIDVLNRVSDVMQSKNYQRVELSLVDELPDTASVRDLSAERALVVFSLLNFKQLPDSAS